MNDYHAELGFFLCVLLIVFALAVDLVTGGWR